MAAGTTALPPAWQAATTVPVQDLVGRLATGRERTGKRRRLFWSTEPAILPRYRNILVVPAIEYVGAVVVAEFEGLMLGDRDGESSSQAGVSLNGAGVWYAVHAGASPKPEIAVERCPKPRFKSVAQMRLEGADGLFGLGVHSRTEFVMRKKLLVGSKKPNRSVGIDDPITPALRQANFGLERPAVVTVVQQLRRVILTGRSHHLEAE